MQVVVDFPSPGSQPMYPNMEDPFLKGRSCIHSEVSTGILLRPLGHASPLDPPCPGRGRELNWTQYQLCTETTPAIPVHLLQKGTQSQKFCCRQPDIQTAFVVVSVRFTRACVYVCVSCVAPNRRPMLSSDRCCGCCGPECCHCRPNPAQNNVGDKANQGKAEVKKCHCKCPIKCPCHCHCYCLDRSAVFREEVKEREEYFEEINAPRTQQYEQELRTLMSVIMETCSHTSSLLVLNHCFRGNKAAEIICESKIPGVPVLGLFKAGDFSVVEDGKKVSDEKGSEQDNEQPTAGEDGADHSPPKEVYQGDQYAGPNRRIIDPKEVLKRTVDLHVDVSGPLRITTSCTEEEKAFERHHRHIKINGGLVGHVTHALLFDSINKLEWFQSAFIRHFRPGNLLMGGTKSAAVRALECFRESLPLFVFRGTGGAADGNI